MKARTLLLSLFVCMFAAALYAAENPNMGTWKLNDAKSKFPPGATKNDTVVYVADGDNIKVTTDGKDKDGKEVHTEWVGKFDGKEYPVTGDVGTGATRSYKVIHERKMELTSKEGDKVTNHGTIEVAKDGKTRTVDVESTAPDGKKMKTKAVYDKE
jgi:endonuclease YncB( thermonuclease family)